MVSIIKDRRLGKLKKKIKVWRYDFWDGTTYFVNPRIPGALKKVDALLKAKRSQFMKLPWITRDKIDRECQTKQTTNAKVTVLEMDETDYKRIRLLK